MENQIPSSTPPSRPVPPQKETTQARGFEMPDMKLNVQQLEALRASMQKARMEIPQQMPIPQQQASAPVAPTPVQQPIPPQVVYVRRNLTVAEILVMLALSCVLVTGVQFVGGKLLEILPRIEVRVK